MCHYPFEAVAAQKDFRLLAYPVHAVVKRMSLVEFTGLYIHVNFKIMMVIDGLFQHNLKKEGRGIPSMLTVVFFCSSITAILFEVDK